MQHVIRSLAAICCGILVFQAHPAAAKRVALVIGNAEYKHTRPLPNPKNDADAIAKLLRDIGFDEVTLHVDLDYRSMREAVRLFGHVAHGAEIAIVYYAGHGLELAGENYLVPVDAKLVRDIDLGYEAVTLASMLDAASAARKLKLVILDACRNNPLGERIALRSGVTRSVPRGLARIEPNGDVLVAYAAKAGTLAYDGAGRHSPYAEALLKHMATPGLDVLRMLGRVREDVLQATHDVQEPWIYVSPSGDTIALVPGKMHAGEEGDVADSLEWARATAANRLDGYRTYLKARPTGKFAPQAHARIAALERLAALWDELKTSRNLPRLQAFANEARATEFGAVATARLQYLEAIEGKDWEDAANKQQLASYRTFVSTWPDGFRTDIAREKIAELEAVKAEWLKVKGSEDEPSIEAFVQQHGWTEFGAEATARLVALRKARAKPDTDGAKTLTAQEMHRLIDNATITFRSSGEVIRFASRSMPTWRKSLGKDFLKRELKQDFAAEGAFASKSGSRSATRDMEGLGGIVESRVDKTGSLFLLQMHGMESSSKDVNRKDRLSKTLQIVKDSFGYVCVATDWHSIMGETKPQKVPERCTVEKVK
jgi:hypothetical protein